MLLPALLLAGPAAAQLYDFDNVVLLAHRDDYGTYSDVWGFVGNDGHEYIIQHTGTGSAWWDIDVPTNPVLVKFIPGPASGWRDAFVIGDHAYLGTEGGGGIQIVDISDPTDPTLVNTYAATVDNSHTIFGDASRNLLFVMGGFADSANGGLQILDATDPVNLVEVGRWTARYVHDGSVEGNVFHANLISDGRFRMINITNPAAPVNFGAAWVGGACHTSWPLGDGVHVAMTEESPGGHLKILDVSVPSAITVTTSDNPGGASTSAHNCHVQGNQLWVAWYTRGVRVYDVSNPAAISEIGFFDTFPQSGGTYSGDWGVYPHLPSGVIAASDISNGLFLLEYDANAGKLDGTISSSGGGLLSGATVEYVNYGLEITTDATGAYRYSVHPGAGHQIRVSAFGHAPDSVTTSVAADGTTTTNFVLTQYPAGAISGRVTDANTLVPIELVELSLVGTQLTEVTDSNGEYSFPIVPTLPSSNYMLSVRRYGYVVPADIPVTIFANSTQTEDIQLVPASTHVDFSSSAGWSVSTDPSVTAGVWTFAEPFGTYSSGIPVQTEVDHTLNPENQCAVTGNLNSGNIGADDVDGGATRLLSPIYDLSGMAEPHAFYYRWYAVNADDDEWQVHVTGDGGANWVLLESTAQDEASWKGIDVDLSGSLASYDAVQFRFTAEDPDPGQIVEAALDDFTIYDAGGGGTGVAIRGPDAARLDLAPNFPNPFSAQTIIDYSVPSKQMVQLSIFDVRGARVATIVDAEMAPGRYRTTWDGRNFAGKETAAGVYFYQLQTADEIRTRKMVRID
jgi:choice-of-anchor B domain-containing protein